MKKMYAISGAGSGIGRAIALKLAHNSPENQLLLFGRRPEALEETQKLLPNPKEHHVFSTSIRDTKKIRTLLSSIEIENLCAILANAGVGGFNSYGPDDRWDEIIATNLTGTYIFINELLPFLKKSSNSLNFRHIVIVSSILAKLGIPGYSAYCASKAGLLGLTRSLAMELAAEKILVNAICPGWVETEMARAGILSHAKFQQKFYEDTLREQMQLVPLHKMSTPEEIANFISFLISDQHTSITGQSIDINNGALMN